MQAMQQDQHNSLPTIDDFVTALQAIRLELTQNGQPPTVGMLRPALQRFAEERRKRYLAALRPHGRLMVLALMFHADEILPAAELEPSVPKDLRKNEREMAALLINTLSGPFEPERYPDEYRQRLKTLIEGRTASARPLAAEVPTGSGVNDLMAALRASVEQARLASKSRGKPAVRRKRKSA